MIRYLESDLRLPIPLHLEHTHQQNSSSYSKGTPEPAAIKVFQENGYTALLTKSPTNQGPNVYAIGRIQVDDEDLNIFLTKISETYLLFKVPLLQIRNEVWFG